MFGLQGREEKEEGKEPSAPEMIALLPYLEVSRVVLSSADFEWADSVYTIVQW